VTLIPGDGVGPEVTGSARRIVEAAGVRIDWEVHPAGASIFKKGIESGIPQETIDSIERTRVALKGPLTTPVGYGEQSANVTLRTIFELYANIRPARELPGVATPFGGRRLDLVVVRENVEDLYAAIEHMQTPGVAQCLKLMSRKGCEKIVRLAFELARAEGRRRVHCATKANIMKLTEGLLKRTFEAVAPEYPEIEAKHIIIDNCAHQLVRFPEQFDVIVMSNMNGDIISDLTSGLAGGLGFAPSANLGKGAVMFEAVHGSAPDIAGKGIVNPTALILSAVLMLRHLGELEAASAIEHAVLYTLEEGMAVTIDVSGRHDAASTDQFTDAVIANLGRRSQRWLVREHKPLLMPTHDPAPAWVKARSRRLVGADFFIEFGGSAAELGRSLEAICAGSAMKLKMISNRGSRVYPPRGGHTDCVDHWRCRFIAAGAASSALPDVTDEQILQVAARISTVHRWMHIEKLHELDGKPAYTTSPGE